jgi:hypothetical protein
MLRLGSWWAVSIALVLLCGGAVVRGEEDDVVLGDGTVEQDLGSSREGSRTDSEVSLFLIRIC